MIKIRCERAAAAVRGDFCEAQGFAHAGMAPQAARSGGAVWSALATALATSDEPQAVTKKVRKGFRKGRLSVGYGLKLNRVGKMMLRQARMQGEPMLQVQIQVRVQSNGLQSLLWRLVQLLTSKG